jgi:hypothetical protein
MAELLTIPRWDLKPSSSDHDPLVTGLRTEHFRDPVAPLQPGRGGSVTSSWGSAFGSVMHALIVLPPLVAGLALLLFGLLPGVFIALILLLLGVAPMLLVAVGMLLTEGVEFTEEDLRRRRLRRKVLQRTVPKYEGADFEDLHLSS